MSKLELTPRHEAELVRISQHPIRAFDPVEVSQELGDLVKHGYAATGWDGFASVFSITPAGRARLHDDSAP